ncbi:hypothetical protein HPB50_018423 [Hyalomma asiaticum]|uniref:Uncharacterized protein n=1 Tax=Hyalomma asiaticum TaxID=266040 RepID=A0ACB7TMT8_HYAAI|nr:hypothetical protein HPB50_018423 [Hyalomma asiaticum]
MLFCRVRSASRGHPLSRRSTHLEEDFYLGIRTNGDCVDRLVSRPWRHGTAGDHEGVAGNFTTMPQQCPGFVVQ